MEPVAFLDGRVTLLPGDCLDVLAGLPENSVDSVVTDPPYHLTSIVKRFGGENAAEAKVGKTGAYARASAGFMGKKWDGGDIAFRVETWAAVLRVMKPGAHLLAFSGTRTYHRMVCAIEDAGFEIRDQIGFAFGSGFPKSHSVGNGWGSALKPAWEPIVLARKPLTGTIASNVLRWGTGALNIDGCRVEGEFESGWSKSGSKASENIAMSGANYDRDPKPDDVRGRWPANLIHDGSEEVLAGFPETAPSPTKVTRGPSTSGHGSSNRSGELQVYPCHGDSGSAARFFYSAKADAMDRVASSHPTVKPLDLMQYLCRLITPPGGTVLDLFAGTGTTGEAAWREGFNAILIEREEEYQADIARRMDLAVKPAKRSAVAKTKGKLMGAEGTPLFGDAA
jgi:site-specific DNA-methyltransferase (adenine-specific)